LTRAAAEPGPARAAQPCRRGPGARLRGAAARTVLAGLALAATTATTTAWAQPATAPRPPPAATASALPWASLSPAQARVLAPLGGVWTSLSPEQQRKWIELAALYPRMSAVDQQRLRERMNEWATMNTAERRRTRLEFQRIGALSPEQRLAQWDAYRALPHEERERLTAQAQRAVTGERAPRPRAGTKPNVVQAGPVVVERPVTHATVQAAPGASTRPLVRGAEPPRHQQAGLPKIIATPTFVDPVTLLPRRGAQAAGVRRPGAPPQLEPETAP
jgi:hypothetical protein